MYYGIYLKMYQLIINNQVFIVPKGILYVLRRLKDCVVYYNDFVVYESD